MATAALLDPAVSPGQWVYRNYAVVATPDNAASPAAMERWATADNTVAAAYIGGQLEVGPWAWPVTPADGTTRMPITQPAVSCNSLNSLPSQPRALVTLLGQTPVTRARAWRPGHAFELIAELFQSYVMPPEPTARIYGAIGVIKGVMAGEHAVDVAGRRGVGFLLTGTGGNQEIIVSPQTCQFTGYQFLGSGPNIHADGAWAWPSSVRRSSPDRGFVHKARPDQARPGQAGALRTCLHLVREPAPHCRAEPQRRPGTADLDVLLARLP